MNKLNEFLSDNSGGLSSNRLAFLAWTLGPFIVWSFLSLMKMDILSIPDSILGIIGIMTTGKVIQRFGEKTETPTPPPTSTQ